MTTVIHSQDYYTAFQDIRKEFLSLGLIPKYRKYKIHKYKIEIILRIRDALSEYAFELQS